MGYRTPVCNHRAVSESNKIGSKRVWTLIPSGQGRDFQMLHRSAVGNGAVKPVFWMGLALACLLAVPPRVSAQASGSKGPSGSNPANGSGQSKPAANSPAGQPGQTPGQVNTQNNVNAFPEDTSSVPVIPTSAPDLPPGIGDNASTPMPLPADDVDPVRTPEEAGAAAQDEEKSSSSSLNGLGDLLPGPDDNTQSGKKHGKDSDIVPEHHESAKEDENVGDYYLDNKDWKGALSRYESALVLDPYNPDVYWGLAECQRHLGDFADARTNYLKVMEYDPGSHHAKDARKALDDPEIANAKPSVSVRPAAQPQQ